MHRLKKRSRVATKRPLRDETPVNNCFEEDEFDQQQLPTKAKEKYRSIVHEHFNLEPITNRFVCIHCGTSFGVDAKGSTGGRLKQLRDDHSSLLPPSKDNPNLGSQKIIDQFFDGSETREPFSKEGFLRSFLEFIILEDEPFRKSESSSLRKVFKLCNAEADLPGRNAIRDRISELYYQKKTELVGELKALPSKISFVVDVWTSANRWSFLGIVARWVTAEWKIKETVIDLSLMEGSHSGTNICDNFVSVLKEFNIFSKLLCVTCDNAANMDSLVNFLQVAASEAGQDFNPQHHRVRCLAHILNLCCQTILSQLKTFKSKTSIMIEDENDCEEISEDFSLVGKIREGIKAIRSSSKHLEEFRRQCTAMDFEDVGLIVDVKTRWNYTYYMLRRVLKLKKVYECVLRNNSDLSKYILDESEWDNIIMIMEMLKKFEEMTVLISKEGVPSMAFCSMVYVDVYRHLEKYLTVPRRGLKGIDAKTNKPYPERVQKAAENAYSKLDKYYLSTDAEAYVVATVLDPSCKLEWYNQVKFPKSTIGAYRRLLKVTWERGYKLLTTTVENRNEFKNDLYSRQMKTSTAYKDELDSYLDSNIANPTNNEGALGWWKNLETDFPHLAKMARDYLSVFGTRVPVERLFSKASSILQPRRCSMKPTTIKETLCCKLWLKSGQSCPTAVFPQATASKVFEVDEDDDFFEEILKE